jgi:alkanesulfonate monooxygenase SsuD/methylene tetrahydromethanopterin reductase-like flavin-dependent oxidoreductase (luciferase family)
MRTFRFGVVATPHSGAQAWRETARRIAGLGYDSLLMPDGLQLLAPFPSLAVAAAEADITVGTFVLAAPLRPPRSVAWEAHSMSVLTEGRFEFGIGTGRPAVEEFARELGLPYGTAAERLAQVGEAIDHLRALDGPSMHTPVLMAAGGPRARALAAEQADIVTLATGPLAGRGEVISVAGDLRAKAGERWDEIAVAMNLFVVGDQVTPWLAKQIGADVSTLIENDSLMVLQGSTQEMVDELERRRDQLGLCYLAVNGEFVEALAPVVERLRGK